MPKGVRAVPLTVQCHRCGVKFDQLGLRPRKWCDSCTKTRNSEKGRAWAVANPERVNENKRERRRRDPDGTRSDWLRHRYGIDHAGYIEMLAAQGGVCAICETPPPENKPLHVDHCHDSGANRALLCHQCNVGLGAFKDVPDRLRAAAAYLEEHRAA